MPFQKGDDPNRLPPEKARAAKEEKNASVVYIESPDDGAPEELIVMRHVFNNGSKFDKTEPQRLARDIREKSPDRFLALKAQLEREHAEKSTGGAVGSDGPDVGSEKAMALARQLIREYNEKQK